jgi:hypothetical protein
MLDEEGPMQCFRWEGYCYEFESINLRFLSWLCEVDHNMSAPLVNSIRWQWGNLPCYFTIFESLDGFIPPA